MQRPVMNPNFFEEAPARQRRRFRPIHWIVSGIWGAIRFVYRTATFDPFSRIVGFRVEEGTATSRFMRGVFYRLAFVPIMIAATACAVVWTATHPRSVTAELDPAWQGIYYEAVTFRAADQINLEGWLVPALSAKTVIQDKEKVLTMKHPAVVLVHDQGQRREQMLPLIKPLHEAGFVVLAINLRGGGPSATRGETFGMQESSDVKAGVEMLRKLTYVDPTRIAIVGCGTGANAALLVAHSDPSICAIVAAAPSHDAADIVKNRLMPQSVWLNWLAPVCKWTFEISYGVDVDEMDLKAFSKLYENHPVLIIDAPVSIADPSDPKIVEQVRSFLASSVGKKPKDAVADVKH